SSRPLRYGREQALAVSGFWYFGFCHTILLPTISWSCADVSWRDRSNDVQLE
ncbi:unnamed protein product, partial [Ascophyllum nodosum]